LIILAIFEFIGDPFLYKIDEYNTITYLCEECPVFLNTIE